MNTLILTASDLEHLVRRVGVDRLMDELIDRLAAAFAEFDPAKTEVPDRAGFHYDCPTPGLIEWMPLYQRSGRVLVKLVGYHPANPISRALPTILSTFSTFDTETGHLVALVDGTFLTALRTGGTAAVATQFLARSDSRTLGIIGCGAQAVTQLHAMTHVLDLEEVLYFDTDASIARSFPERVGSFVDAACLRPVAAPDELVKASDVICVATAVGVDAGPVFSCLETKPWAHINAIGSDLPGKFELPLELLKNSFRCADNPDQARREGECQRLPSDASITALTQMARFPDEFRSKRDSRTIFDSTGWALEDQVITDLILELAELHECGTSLSIESVPPDPWNPYHFLDEKVGTRSKPKGQDVTI